VLDLGLQTDAEGVGAERVDLCGGVKDDVRGGAHAYIVTDTGGKSRGWDERNKK
jgi:hypothetical protein